MHMADALVSPAVGGAMWAASISVAAFSTKKVQAELDERKVPLMGVMGAFIFAAQMINFAIPGTGSSGHLGGGLILAAVLGPYAGYLTMASILIIQALFFADGGLLALGCNIFNLGFYTCFLAYPLIFKPVVGNKPSRARIIIAATVAAITGLQLGAFSVILETVASGIAELPIRTFFWLMQPIHLAIGLVEGLVTAAVVTYVWRARPEIIENRPTSPASEKPAGKNILITLIIITLLTGGILSWFASSQPDGLEWSIFHTSGQAELGVSGGIHSRLAKFQEMLAPLPDYSFKPDPKAAPTNNSNSAWPSPDRGRTVSGLVGALLTLGLVLLIIFGINRFKKITQLK